METPLFPPMVASVLLILIGAISMVVLVGLAYNYSLVIRTREKTVKIDELEHEVKALQREVKGLKAQLVQKDIPSDASRVQENHEQGEKQAVSAGVEEKKLKREVWQSFVDDYNNLANSMNVPKAAEACKNFVRNNKVQLLTCVASKNADSGQTPAYVPVDEVESSIYWAWQVSGQADAFVVVPNPLQEYDEELHHNGGMKETFASNYETGCFKQIQVKLPAHFMQRQGSWKIVQPGVIRVK